MFLSLSVSDSQHVSAPRNAQNIVIAHQKKSMKELVDIFVRVILQNKTLYTIIPPKYR